MIRVLVVMFMLIPSWAWAQAQPASVYLGNGTFAAGVAINCLSGGTWAGCPPGGGGSSAPTAVTATSRGGTITAGGTDQVLAAANGARLALVIQNPCSATESLFVNLGAAATVGGSANAADLPACGSVTLAIASGLIDREAVHVIAATTGHVFIAKEY